MTRAFHGKQLKVGGAIYTVHEVEGLHRKLNLLGNVDFSDCIIQIDSAMSDERKEQTIVHEMLHAIHFEAGYDSEDQDEDMINRTANVLHQVIVDNIDILATPDEEKAVNECSHEHVLGTDYGRRFCAKCSEELAEAGNEIKTALEALY